MKNSTGLANIESIYKETKVPKKMQRTTSYNLDLRTIVNVSEAIIRTNEILAKIQSIYRLLLNPTV